MRSFSPTSGASTDRRGKIPAFERHKAARQRLKIRARRVASLARLILHLAGTDAEGRVIAHDRLCQNDVQVGESAARPR